MKRIFLVAVISMMILTATSQTNRFCIAKDGETATILVDESDWKGVLRAANDLGDDVRKVTGTAAQVEFAAVPQQQSQQVGSIIAGTIG